MLVRLIWSACSERHLNSIRSLPSSMRMRAEPSLLVSKACSHSAGINRQRNAREAEFLDRVMPGSL